MTDAYNSEAVDEAIERADQHQTAMNQAIYDALDAAYAEGVQDGLAQAMKFQNDLAMRSQLGPAVAQYQRDIEPVLFGCSCGFGEGCHPDVCDQRRTSISNWAELEERINDIEDYLGV